MTLFRDWMRDKRVAGALAALAVLFVAYRVYTAAARKPARIPPPAGEGTAQISSTVEPGAAVPGGKVEPTPLNAISAGEIAWSWGRNPFLPQWREKGAGETAAVESQTAAEVPSGLRGTVISGNSGIAIFGSRLVPRGETIGEWTVERVDPYSVSLRKGKEVRVVELFKPAPTGGKGRGGDR